MAEVVNHLARRVGKRGAFGPWHIATFGPTALCGVRLFSAHRVPNTEQQRADKKLCEDCTAARERIARADA